MGTTKIHARRPRAGRLLLASTIGLLSVGVLTTACTSLSKPDLSERLLALEKNAPLREAGVQSIVVKVELGQGPTEMEAAFVALKREGREPSKRPVMLVHGTPSTLFTWSGVMASVGGAPGLVEDRDVYALEVIGHGIAPGEYGPYDFERCARFVSAVIRELGVGPVHLVGNSYGGEFAWRAALNDPDLVASLVLMSSSGLPRLEGDWLPEEVEMRENPLAGIGWWINSPERVERALEPHFREIPPERVEEFFLVCENADNWGAMIDLARDEEGYRAGELPELASPTLLLWGAEDIAYPVETYAHRFEEMIPRARVELVEGAGHYPHEERPAEVVRSLERFFDQQEAQP